MNSFLQLDISPNATRVNNYSPDEFFRTRKRAPSAFGGSQQYVDMKNYMPVSKLGQSKNITESVLRSQTPQEFYEKPKKLAASSRKVEELFHTQNNYKMSAASRLDHDDILLAQSPSTKYVRQIDHFSSGKTLRPFSTQNQRERKKRRNIETGISSILLKNLQEEKQREQQLLLQEKLYKQKLDNIRRILEQKKDTQKYASRLEKLKSLAIPSEQKDTLEQFKNLNDISRSKRKKSKQSSKKSRESVEVSPEFIPIQNNQLRMVYNPNNYLPEIVNNSPKLSQKSKKKSKRKSDKTSQISNLKKSKKGTISAVSYVQDDRISESCSSINIQIQNSNKKKRSKMFSAQIRKNGNLIKNEKPQISIQSQKKIIKMENEINQEEIKLQQQKENSKAQMSQLLRDESIQSEPKLIRPKSTKNISRQQSSRKSRINSGKSRPPLSPHKPMVLSNICLSPDRSEQSPTKGSQMNYSQKRSREPQFSEQRYVPPDEVSTVKIQSDSDQPMMSEDRQQEFVTEQDLEEEVVKVQPNKEYLRIGCLGFQNNKQEEPSEKFPEIRTVFQNFDEGTLLEYINEAAIYTEKYSTRNFVHPRDLPEVSEDMVDLGLLNFEMLFDEQQSRANQIDSNRKQLIDNLNGVIDAPLYFIKSYNLQKSDFFNEFISTYRSKNLNNFVWTENFRENSKQWRLAYDPYMAESMLTIYGREPPQSFKIRQKIFETQRNILDRYSHPTPVHDRQSVLDEIQRHFNMSRRDYLAEKQYQRYLLDSKDISYIQKYTPNLENVEFQRVQYEGYVEVTQIKDRIQHQKQIEKQFEQIDEQISQFQLANDDFEHSKDQSDFQTRYQRNLTFQKAFEFDTDKVVNDDTYKKYFCAFIQSLIKQIKNDKFSQKRKTIQRVIHELHLKNKENFHFENLTKRYYAPYSLKISLGSKHNLKQEQPFSLCKSEILALKSLEFNLRKRHFYPEHYDFSILQQFIFDPRLQNVKFLLGCDSRIRRSVSWFIQFHQNRPQYTDQQYVQSIKTQKQIINGAQQHIHFLKPFLETNDQDLVPSEGEMPRPYSIERLFCNLIYRSKAILEQNNLMFIFEVHFNVHNYFEEKKVMIDALNQAIFDRYQYLNKEVKFLFQKRKIIIDKKMGKWRYNFLAAKTLHKQDLCKKIKRYSSPQQSRIQGFEQEYVSAFWPLTEEIMYPHRARERIFKKICDVEEFEEFQPPIKPYTDHLPVKHLQRLMTYFESKMQINFIRKSRAVRMHDEPKIINWLESFYDKQDIPQDGPLSLHQRLPKVHLEYPVKMKKVTIENDVPLKDLLNSSSDDNQERFDMDNSAEQLTEFGQQDKMKQYFDTQLRKELRQAVVNVDVTTLSNYIESLQGTLKAAVNYRDLNHQGNTLMHQAILQLDKINGLNPETGLRSKVYSKKLDIIKIVTLLISEKAGSEVNISNELGYTALDYVNRLRLAQDKNMVLEIIKSKI